MSEKPIDKEKECFERLRVMNKRKAHISALRRYSNHLLSLTKVLNKRIEKEQNRETQNYLKRFLSYIETQLDMIMLSIERGLKEIEELEDIFDVECRNLVEEKRQQFIATEYNITFVNPSSIGDDV
jgi:exonuclease VII large subunit